MAGLLVRTVKSAVLFAYGIAFMLFYTFLQIKAGDFFRSTTEKEELELLIGRLLDTASSNDNPSTSSV